MIDLKTYGDLHKKPGHEKVVNLSKSETRLNVSDEVSDTIPEEPSSFWYPRNLKATTYAPKSG